MLLIIPNGSLVPLTAVFVGARSFLLLPLAIISRSEAFIWIGVELYISRMGEILEGHTSLWKG